MGQSRSTEIQLFAGGISLVPANHLLQPSQSRFLAGANIRKGNLHPFLAPLFIEEATGNYMYYFDNEFNYYDLFRSNVLFNRIWYWTSIAGAGKKYWDGTEASLGIEPPITPPTITAQTSIKGLEGSISYVYTYYDTKSGAQSPPSRPSNTLDLIGVDAGQAIEVRNMDVSPDGYQIRLYRIGGLQTMYTAVETLPTGTTSMIDDLSFTEMEGLILDSAQSYPPPAGLQYLTQHQGRFFGAVGAELMFTPPGNPDSWYLLNFLPFDDNITGIVAVANGLLVMSAHKTWLVAGSSPLQFAIHTLSLNEGCMSAATIATKDGSAIWRTDSGFVMSNGSSLQNISLNQVGRLENIEPYGAVFIDNRYILSFGGSLYPSNELYPSDDLHPSDIISDGIALPKGAIVIDFTMGKPIYSTITDVVMGYITTAENEVYQLSGEGTSQSNITTEDGAFNLITESGHSNIVADVTAGASLSKMFNGKSLREIEYRSPVYTEGSIGAQKQYEKVRIVYNGIGTIEIKDELGNEFLTVTLASSSRVSQWLNIPVEFNKGFGIQYKITGVLVVDSLQWVWTAKEIL